MAFSHLWKQKTFISISENGIGKEKYCAYLVMCIAQYSSDTK